MFVGRAVAQNIFVGIADSESWKKIAFDLWNPSIPVFHKGSFGSNHEVRPVGGKGGAWARRESGDGLGGGLDGFEGSGCGIGDFCKLTFSEEVKMVS